MYSEQELEDLWQEFLEHREASIAYAELPYYEIQAIDLGAVHGENPFSQMMLPAYDKLSAATANTRAQILGTVLVAAVEWYRSDHGLYPSSLAQLTPQFVSEMPIDPFTGNGFLFHSRGSGYLLYSTGKDMRDDGGDPGEYSDEGKDIVINDS